MVEGPLESFGKNMREVEMAKLSLDRERLAIDFKLMEEERTARQEDRTERSLDREKDRIERIEDREAMQRLELDKFKLMMEAFGKKWQKNWI